MKEPLVDYSERTSTVGEGITVKVDETKIKKQKLNCIQFTEGDQENCNTLYLVKVSEQLTLQNIIKAEILPRIITTED